ncbi:hypothetical protein, partial [Allokutzneria sp. NRRL B-24872]|uniref:hypothetical protein n=1 Tax=Allokutzneria sp. NRRL B-24872 TaxID=1137961 RepID=UPI001AEFDC4D
MFELAEGSGGDTAMALVSTIAHDGNGGVADAFSDDEGVSSWCAARFSDLAPRSPAQAERLRAL